MTNGIDDIIKGGVAFGRKVAKRVSKLETKFITRNMKSHPSVSQMTKKDFKKTAAYMENTKKAAKAMRPKKYNPPKKMGRY